MVEPVFPEQTLRPGIVECDAWSRFMLHCTSAFPDACISMEACIAEGDTLVSR
jgi:predicted ester cyclase